MYAAAKYSRRTNRYALTGDLTCWYRIGGAVTMTTIGVCLVQLTTLDPD